MEKNKGGRPRKEINQKEFEKLCSLQCTKQEICGWFDITDKTLESWCKRTYQDEDGRPMGFSEVFSVKRGAGMIALRRAQFQLSQKNAAMAIFLGKNLLNQKDTVEQTVHEQSTIELIAQQIMGEQGEDETK